MRCIPSAPCSPGDIETHVAQMDKDYDIVVASGGDGTVNIVLNALMHNNLKIPLGIAFLPAQPMTLPLIWD